MVWVAKDIFYNFIGKHNTHGSQYFFLSGYLTKEKKIISKNGVKYELQLFQGDHSNEYLISEMKDGVIEGRCQLFNRGILSLAWKVTNGNREGGIILYERGKALYKENWDYFFGRNDKRTIVNSKNRIIMTIHCKKDNDSDDNEDSSDCLIYKGGFDAEMNRDGCGTEYDKKSGKELFEGFWKKDRLVKVIREFEINSNTMIEYSDKSGMDVWQRIPLYIGGYCCVNGSFYRNGTGYLIDESSGAAIRESEWDHGKEIRGQDLYEGWYEKGTNDSIRSIFNDLNQDNIQDELSYSTYTTNLVRIQHSEELYELDLRVSDLVVASNCGNNLSSLNLNRYSWLKSIEIGDNCFGKVDIFSINGLSKLRTLKIGSCSFTGTKNSYGENYHKSFHVVNCNSLELIMINDYSFSDYSGIFELKNLNSLRSLYIGCIGKHSNNFYFSSFIVRGSEYTVYYQITDLPNLELIQLGDAAFCYSSSTVIESRYSRLFNYI